MLKIVLVEDNEEAKETVVAYLERYAQENGTEYNLTWFDHPMNFLDRFRSNYDVVLMDIQLPDMNGMETAHRLREVDPNVPLVFITNMAQYAIKGYEVDASDFIVKPISYYDFALKFERLLKKVKKNDDFKLMLEGGKKYIPIDEVRYVEVYKHKLQFHLSDGTIEARGSLSKVEEQLAERGFARCNNYCLVNLRCVLGIKGYVLTVSAGAGGGTDEIQISQPRKKDFLRRFNEYLRDHA